MKKGLILIILFIVLFFVIGVFFWQGIYLPKSSVLTEEKIFLVEKGENLFQIAENLEKEDLIKNRFFFNFYVLIKGAQGKLQAGEYSLSPSMNIAEIAEKIILGNIIKEEITIIEGWNLRDIGFYFENKGMFQAEEIWEAAGFPAVDYSRAKDLPTPLDFSSNYDFLKQKPKNVGLEGYLFPDTYLVNKGASIEEIVKKMLDNFNKKLTPDLREEIKRQNKTINKIIKISPFFISFFD